MSYPMSAAIVGIALAAFILLLLRRDQLYLRDAMFWLCTAVISVAFSIVPQLVDWLGLVAGVAYPPALILALVSCVLIVKSLLADDKRHFRTEKRGLVRMYAWVGDEP